ncbi:hypothetical protein GCM10007854_28700 [Algimonas porphyrae]|uniref:Uncharacterized protein n=1 Tax=Algimonas porphyrae TaxID=1128113 RepID=A0ABQ5V306_9PROT|nr:hypothetical protein GCM10007854_28700 [Algimonas porphyrae]
MNELSVPHEADLIAGSDLKMRLGHAHRIAGAGESELLAGNNALCLAPRLAEPGTEQPCIEAAGWVGRIAQDLSSSVLPVPLRAARAAKGEFSNDLADAADLPPDAPR